MLYVEVRIEGGLDAHWSSWFEDLAIVPAEAETLLAGLVADQAALYGLLARLRDLAIPLRGVDSVALPGPADPGGGRAWGAGAVESLAGAWRPNPALAGRAQFSFGLRWEAGGAGPAGRVRFHFPAADLSFVSDSVIWLEAAEARVRCHGAGRLNTQRPCHFRLAVCEGSAADGAGSWRLELAAPNETQGLYDTERGQIEGSVPATRLAAGRIAISPAGGRLSVGR